MPLNNAPFFWGGQSGGGGNSYTAALNYLVNHQWSSGLYEGFALTDNGNGTVNVASGRGVLRTAPSMTAEIRYVEVPAVNNIALADNATNYLYVDYNSGSPVVLCGTSISDFNCLDKCILYRASRTGSTVMAISMMGNNVDANRLYRRKTFEEGGIEIGQGARLSETGQRKLNVTAGTYWAILSRIESVSKDTSGSDSFGFYFHSGTSWTHSTSQQVDNLNYDNGAGLAELTSGRYGTRYVFMLLDQSGGSLAVVCGPGNHKTISDAANELVPGDLPPEVLAVGVLIGMIIVQKSAVNFSQILLPAQKSFQSALPTIHNNLSGLQGGAVDEYYHVAQRIAAALPITLPESGGVRLADNLEAASESNEGTMRYRKTANSSHIEVSVKTGAASYAWVAATPDQSW